MWFQIVRGNESEDSALESVAQSVASESVSNHSYQSTISNKKHKVAPDQVLDLVPQKLQPSDEGTLHLGKHVPEELQRLPEEMAMFCKKIIDTIFEAHMGTLSRNSRTVVTSVEPSASNQFKLFPYPQTSTPNPNLGGQYFSQFLF
jgi:hypothetical protein